LNRFSSERASYGAIGLRSTRSGSLVLETAAMRRRLERMMSAMQEREESDQLPEEGPSEQIVDDTGGAARDEAEETPGHPGEEQTQTGNPAAAGQDEGRAGEG
jgi:hypothetical protein